MKEWKDIKSDGSLRNIIETKKKTRRDITESFKKGSDSELNGNNHHPKKKKGGRGSSL